MNSILQRARRRLASRNMKLADRDAWIRSLVPGRTFVDVGGLWGTLNEKVSTAVQAGAAAATMLDVQPPGNKWWQLFEQRCAELGVTGYQSLVADICKPAAVRKLGRFDVVHCSGIMYHVPDVLGFLRNLYRMTGSHLILTSMVVPGVIRNAAGTLRLPRGAMLSVPGMEASARAVLSRHFTDLDITIKDINAGAPQYLEANLHYRTGPWWWLYSPETMKALVQVFPFKVLDEGYTSLGRTYSLLLQVHDLASGDVNS